MTDEHGAPSSADTTMSPLGRRDVLRAGLLAAGASVFTGGAIAGTAEALGVGTRSARHPRAATAPALVESITRRNAPPQPVWVKTWSRAVRTIDDFERRSPHSRYSRNAIMLTIDDGPDPHWTPKYLRLLHRHHVTATFNVIGEQVREHPALIRAIVSEGHHIGNHTYHHPLDLPDLSHRRIRDELADTTDAIVRASGFRPRQFRAPGGNWGPHVFSEVSRQEMMPLGWDIDPRDWALPGVGAIRSAMLRARPHDIILCHDGGGDRSQTYRALATVVPALLARGWTFVTLPSTLAG